MTASPTVCHTSLLQGRNTARGKPAASGWPVVFDTPIQSATARHLPRARPEGDPVDGAGTHALDTVVQALHGRRQANGSWPCRCPVPSHGQGKGDKHPSLSVAQGDERLLVHCFAGCDAGAVLEELHRRGLAVKAFEFSSTQRGGRAGNIKHSLGKVLYLWSVREPIEGSIGERYLRKVRQYQGSFPSTLAFLPQSRPDRHPAMIAAFGIPHEPEPGRLELSSEAIQGVHLTLLKPDGSGKADIEPNKIMVGKSSGWPIVLAAPNDLLGLVVTEGIEDALTLHDATGLGAWSAGSATRLPSLARIVPDYIENVVVGADRDPVGRRHAQHLRDALLARGIPAEIKLPPDPTSRAV